MVYIKYLFDKYLQNEPDYFQDDYDEALKTLCTTDEDLRYWKELLEPHLPEEMPDRQDGGSFQAEELISMKLYILSKLKERAEFYALMEKHYRSSPDLSIRYARQLSEMGNGWPSTGFLRGNYINLSGVKRKKRCKDNAKSIKG